MRMGNRTVSHFPLPPGRHVRPVLACLGWMYLTCRLKNDVWSGLVTVPSALPLAPPPFGFLFSFSFSFSFRFLFSLFRPCLPSVVAWTMDSGAHLSGWPGRPSRIAPIPYHCRSLCVCRSNTPSLLGGKKIHPPKKNLFFFFSKIKKNKSIMNNK